MQAAMDRRPTPDEARAAQYNAACAFTRKKQWADAVRCLKSAINEYDLRLTVALKDDDLGLLRERREFQVHLHKHLTTDDP